MACAVKDHRGNSSILIGPRASGKSTLIKQLIDKIVQENSAAYQIESLTLQGAIFSETQSVLKFLLNKFKALVNSSSSTVYEEDTEDLSEFVNYHVIDLIL